MWFHNLPQTRARKQLRFANHFFATSLSPFPVWAQTVCQTLMPKPDYPPAWPSGKHFPFPPQLKAGPLRSKLVPKGSQPGVHAADNMSLSLGPPSNCRTTAVLVGPDSLGVERKRSPTDQERGNSFHRASVSAPQPGT